MAIKTWNENGKTLYRINVHSISRVDRKIRSQKQKSGMLDTTDVGKIKRVTERIERKLYDEARAEIRHREGVGISWEGLREKWIEALYKGEGTRNPISKKTRDFYILAVNEYTKDWVKNGLAASEINPGDIEDLFRKIRALEYSESTQYNIKTAINQCFNYAIRRRLVRGMSQSPAFGFGISRKQSKRSEILTFQQIVYFLSEAKKRNHPWYPVWKFVLHTGARSGEAYQATCGEAVREEKRLYFEEKYDFYSKEVGELKDHEWRQVPINEELDELFVELDVYSRPLDDKILPRIRAWRNCDAAKVIRKFCEEIGVPSVCFHTLRACWATQLLINGVAETTVMEMGGWADRDTMQRYIRRAGISISGATESLRFEKAEDRSNVVFMQRAQAARWKRRGLQKKAEQPDSEPSLSALMSK
ncbi:MAG: hypothetical protein CL678_12245 [Bdellovibrionaceae bacterium]|nr:hypothetical protein [Pseudobdellovibrionaceae bacterium]|tara:strand:+ start:3281 stop:4534 length:1254 start_codon:yes stop_codon:yes gene_type:complete